MVGELCPIIGIIRLSVLNSKKTYAPLTLIGKCMYFSFKAEAAISRLPLPTPEQAILLNARAVIWPIDHLLVALL